MYWQYRITIQNVTPILTDGIHTEISSMSATPSEKRKDSAMAGSKVKKKALMLPPLCKGTPPLSAAFARSLFSQTPILRNATSDRSLSVVELPNLVDQIGPERATDVKNWTGPPRLMASALGTHIPMKTADESTAQRYM